MTEKKVSFAALAVSGLGAAAALGAANHAGALHYMRINSTDFLSNMATKPTTTSAGFSVGGYNSLGATTAYSYRSGNTVYANIYSQGGSAYTRAFARCYSANYNIHSAVYSNYTYNSTYKSISCSSLPADVGPWSLVGWGATVMSAADSSIPGSNRKICDGQGCADDETFKVGSGFLNGYPALTTTKVLIGGESGYSVPGPSTPIGLHCW